MYMVHVHQNGGTLCLHVSGNNGMPSSYLISFQTSSESHFILYSVRNQTKEGIDLYIRILTLDRSVGVLYGHIKRV
jgi:hypothetical protein